MKYDAVIYKSWTQYEEFVSVLVAMHLVELVLLAELNTLFPAVVALKEVCCDPPKFNQLMLLQALGQ